MLWVIQTKHIKEVLVKWNKIKVGGEGGGCIQIHTLLYRIYFEEKNAYIIFLPLHRFVKLFVGLSNKILVKYTDVFYHNVAKCKNVGGFWLTCKEL